MSKVEKAEKEKKKILKDYINSAKPLLKYFDKYKGKLLFYSILLFIFNMSFVFTGYLIGAATEAVTLLDVRKGLFYLFIYFLIATVSYVVIAVVYYLFNKVQTLISRRIGLDVYNKTLKLPAKAFEDLSTGELVNRVTSDTESIIGISQKLVEMVSRIIAAALILVYIFINSYIVGFEIIIFLVVYYFIVKYYTKKLKKYREETKKENDKYTSLTTESIRGIREIKTLGIVNRVYSRVDEVVKRLTKVSFKGMEETAKYDSICDTMCGFLESLVFITCAILVGTGKSDLTFFIAMTYYVYRYTWIIHSVTDFSKDMARLSVSFDRISDILYNKLYEDVKFGDKELKNIKGVVEFKNVTFNYPNEGVILNDFSIKFEPNKKIAIVGASGGGKTTIFNLLTRLFDTDKGSITIDGIDIKELNEKSLRNNISIIRQEPFIFNMSIKDNFRMLDENITLKEIRKYCKLASIDDYIMSLPKKYDTVLGEGGVNLSGGQKQRIAIARTLLKKSKIILMDEATSALDNASQKIIKDSIDVLAKDHTVLIVAHRLSTIIDADEIYVIENGKVLDHGTHESLMKSCKYYQKLHTIEDKIV